MNKTFKISADEIKSLAPGYGGCIASDRITVDGSPVCFMYREAPTEPVDSGWRFLAGDENQDYMDDASNHAIYDVNTIVNYDPTIATYLDAPIGSAFERESQAEQFQKVTDWDPDSEA